MTSEKPHYEAKLRVHRPSDRHEEGKPFIIRLFHPCNGDRHGRRSRDASSLYIQLTDEGLSEESDTEVKEVELYSLTLTETEYDKLRKEQSLRIDFESFPEKLIDLLNKCDDQQYFLSLSKSDTLEIMQNTQLRPVALISLPITLADDRKLIHYLSMRVHELQRHLEQSRSTVEKHREELDDMMDKLQRRAEDIRHKDDEIRKLQNDHESELASHRRSLEAKQEEINFLHTQHQSLENQLYESKQEQEMLKRNLEETQRELNECKENKSTTESQLSETREKLKQMEEELADWRSTRDDETTEMRNHNKSLQNEVKQLQEKNNKLYEYLQQSCNETRKANETIATLRKERHALKAKLQNQGKLSRDEQSNEVVAH
eukprot:gb/GECG01001268.1/.p1 GENE.gb/GECG01001268.1/~~gb/GECG01001268.1/.p1  ORF type:complete len:374 (+),score=75.72 gb/GECG01001268.1/:1-1122(+)